MSNRNEWVELSICQTCVFVVEYGEIHDEHDQASADALEANWTGWHLWTDCLGDCEDRPEDHECAGGFTWSPCDLCSQTGREDIRVYAERIEQS